MQFDERGDNKLYEAKRVRVEKGEGGSWAVLSISFVAGSEVLKGGLLDGDALMNLADSGDPELVFDVGVMIVAYSAWETTVQVEGGSEERKREGGEAAKDYGDPKRRVELPPLVVGRLVCECGSGGPRCSSVNAPIRLYF
jgi:hypothetical protein